MCVEPCIVKMADLRGTTIVVIPSDGGQVDDEMEPVWSEDILEARDRCIAFML